ncbi:FAD-dependent oxidoreductase [Lachnospiraceae bacterium]|jgi:ribulose 1,5-bisphosphate synthetase/thiazole synthase|nr:FAD-dependent oxidoreductase [Lachnospiraceae bacterium]
MGRFCYEEKYDVLIAGGGVSGAVSAIAAGRMGAKVLVIEQNGYLGGSLTGCGVGPMMTFHAGEKQVILGIMEEIVGRLVNRGYSVGHIYDTMQYISYLTPFNAEGLKLILDEMLEEAGCRVLFHTFTGGVHRERGRINFVTICNKDGLHRVEAKIYVDATGDGDIAFMAGASMTKGRETDGAAQPMTMNMKYANVDTEKLKAYISSHIESFPVHKRNRKLMDTVSRFSFRGFDEEFRTANREGIIDIPREDILCFETDRKGEYIVNTTRITSHDGTDAASLSDAERIGRRQCSQLDAFLRKNIPGFEHALLEYTGPSVGIRGSRQLVGAYTLSETDILERKQFAHVIAHCAYPIDIHNPDGTGTASRFLSDPDTYYSIPYEVMYSMEIENLLVTGRCISASFEAQAAIRTTPTAGALGHACGIAAALAARSGENAAKVDVKELQKYLKAQGAYLDLPESKS